MVVVTVVVEVVGKPRHHLDMVLYHRLSCGSGGGGGGGTGGGGGDAVVVMVVMVVMRWW